HAAKAAHRPAGRPGPGRPQPGELPAAVRNRFRASAGRAARGRLPGPGQAPPGGPLMSEEIGLNHYLVLGALLFVCGAVCMATKRNAIGVLIGVELALNGANINFVAFARFNPAFEIEGQVFTLFVIELAAAEAAAPWPSCSTSTTTTRAWTSTAPRN